METAVSPSQTTKFIASRAQWPTLFRQMQSLVPEAFSSDGHVLNLIDGTWSHPGHGRHYISPVDGTTLGSMPYLDLESAKHAVKFAAAEFEAWSKVDLDERKRRVADCVQRIKAQRELIALLLTWEIGKPYQQSLVSVDRCVSGVEWYIDNIEGMMDGRKPLGLISNIASWNYPLSVLVHAMLVQVLAGNASIAKTPSDGGLYALTVSLALARRSGLPVSLVSGSGGQLSEALVRNPDVACLSFVGGKTNGRDIASSLYDRNKRYMLEMEGVNAYGIWEFSEWSKLAQQLKKGFEYGKQRCTAYARFVIQRQLFPQFLDTYLPVLKSLRFGHPLLVENDSDPLPALDFGPLINAKKVEELRVMTSEVLGNGGVALYEGDFDESLFLPNQDEAAYCAPMSLINVPRNAKLYHNEPFGPIDTLIVVDRIEELITEMNVSNGSLVSTVASDDPAVIKRVSSELRSFKVGANAVRSRGDRDEVFGGIGQSWKGCFVGGKYLVQGVTEGPAGEQLFGNFPDHIRLPEVR